MTEPFIPQKLPIKMENEDIIDILKLENDARAMVEKFNSILERSVIQKELLLLFSMKESVESTRIEGTQATISEVVESDATGKKSKDIEEVFSYLEGLRVAEDLLKVLPISTRLFLKIHETILKNGRGEHRNPGEYRVIQNFIGPTKDIKNATYIPPTPNLVSEYMSNLEKYINDEYTDNFGYLSRTAIIHGQFETIHPFLDGNGRMGRILIIIYLLEKNILSFPAFFVSEELEKNKNKYYALLNNLRSETPEWKEWIIFFLNASINQADKYIEKLVAIEELYDDLIKIAQKERVPETAVLYMFNHPVFTINNLKDGVEVSYATARRYVKVFEDAKKIYGSQQKRNRLFHLYDLLDLL